MSDIDKQTTKPKKVNSFNEIHPRAQAKLDELRRRGLIGNNGVVQVAQPKKQETEQKDEQQ